jgi:hypothetical protein
MSEARFFLLIPDYQKFSDPSVISVHGSLFDEDKGSTQQQNIILPVTAVTIYEI